MKIDSSICDIDASAQGDDEAHFLAILNDQEQMDLVEEFPDLKVDPFVRVNGEIEIRSPVLHSGIVALRRSLNESGIMPAVKCTGQFSDAQH